MLRPASSRNVFACTSIVEERCRWFLLVALCLVGTWPASATADSGNPSGVSAAPQQKHYQFDTPSCALESQLFADAADGHLDHWSPFDAALVASGIQDVAAFALYRHKAGRLAEELRQSIAALPDAPQQRARAVFEFMHERMLRGGYNLAHTDLRRTFDEGRYNCVTATVLFNYLASEVGLDCCGLEMPGHAMSRVKFSEGFLDIENTCPRWFQLDEVSRRQTTVPQATGPTSIDRTQANVVTPIQLAAMIYYNRGVDYLGEKQFAAAAAVNAKALRLDPNNKLARGNFLATINNWAIDLGGSQHFAEAVDLLRQGLAIDAQFDAFSKNFIHVHRQWIDRLCAEGRFDEALAILTHAAEEMPNRDFFHQVQTEVRQRWAKSIASSPAK